MLEARGILGPLNLGPWVPFIVVGLKIPILPNTPDILYTCYVGETSMEAHKSLSVWTLTHRLPAVPHHCDQLAVTRERDAPPTPPWQSLGKLQSWQSRPHSDRLCDLEQTFPWGFGVGR